MIAPDPAWRAPERWVWEQTLAGGSATLTPPNTRDAAQADLWVADRDSRTIRAAAISAMLSEPPWRDALPPGGLKIIGAVIPDGLSLKHLRVARPIWLEHCRIEGDLDLEDASTSGQLSLDASWIGGTANLNCGRFGFVSCVGTRFAGVVTAIMARVDFAFAASLVRVGGDMRLSGMTVGAELVLDAARIRGKLECDRLRAGNIMLGKPGRSTIVGGGISMIAAAIDADLTLGPLAVGRVRDASYPACIIAQRLTVGGWLTLGGVAARDMLDFSFSRLSKVDFDNQAQFVGDIAMHGAVVTDELLLRSNTRWRRAALLDLRNAHAGALQDELPDSWPKRLHLHGFTLDRLGGFGSTGATSFMEREPDWFIEILTRTSEAQERPQETLWPQLPGWVRRIVPRPANAPPWLRKHLVPADRNLGYRPSTYATFAERLRNLGRVATADYLAYASREIDRRNAIFPRRQGLWLLRATMGYGIGYRYFRALYWVVGLAAVCIATAAIDASLFGWHRSVFAGHSLSWVIYACISHVLPIVSLDKAYDDALPKQIMGAGGKLVFHLVTLCGWLLGGMLAAGLSGLTQRPK